MTEKEIQDLIHNDPWMMSVLRVAKQIELPDWMIGAGFVRNKIWDKLHGFEHKEVDTPDIDLIYFNLTDVSLESEKIWEAKARSLLDVPWSIKNMARMHIKNGDSPYADTADGLAHWVETATCVAVKLDSEDNVKLIAPHGLADLVGLVLRPSPHVRNRMEDFHSRLEKKGWLQKWPKLKVVLD